MNVLGISTEHDAGVVLLEKGRLTWAANEERYSRRKFQTGTPKSALAKLAQELKTKNKTLPQNIAVASIYHVDTNLGDIFALPPFFEFLEKVMSITSLDRLFWGTCLGAAILKVLAPAQQGKRRSHLGKILASHGVRHPHFTFVDHHYCHAAGAYYTSGWSDCVVITQDASGDGLCSKVFLGENGKLRQLYAVPFYHSPGYYYAYVTQILGFKLGREGKVTGLAASGNSTRTLPILLKEMTYREDLYSYRNHGLFRKAEIRRLTRKLSGFSREDVAAGAQKHLELMVVSYIRDMLRQFAPKLPAKLAVAGGVFANVRLNQKIAALPEVSSLWIYPHMGDGGLAAGAALAVAAQSGLKPRKLPHAYLGDAPSQEEIEETLKQFAYKLRVKRPTDLVGEIAKLLAKGKVVAVVRGPMEYGPRALGHRSLLYQATDPTVNDWLNQRLRRSEFMPFAPILLESDLPRYFTDWKKVRPSLPYMTVTVDCNRRCKKEAPAIVHVDGTARPQIIRREVEPFMHAVLAAYRKATGRRILINTSYNIHEEPIVRTATDAIKTFLDGHLDALVIEDYLITLK